MAFTQTNAAPAQPATPQAPVRPMTGIGGLAYNTGYYGGAPTPTMASYMSQPWIRNQQQQQQAAPTYKFTPEPFVPPPNSQAQGDLYANPNAPWAIPMQGQQGGGTQTPSQPTNTGGWDASAFMQGLRSLGFQGY